MSNEQCKCPYSEDNPHRKKYCVMVQLPKLNIGRKKKTKKATDSKEPAVSYGTDTSTPDNTTTPPGTDTGTLADDTPPPPPPSTDTNSPEEDSEWKGADEHDEDDSGWEVWDNANLVDVTSNTSAHAAGLASLAALGAIPDLSDADREAMRQAILEDMFAAASATASNNVGEEVTITNNERAEETTVIPTNDAVVVDTETVDQTTDIAEVTEVDETAVATEREAARQALIDEMMADMEFVHNPAIEDDDVSELGTSDGSTLVNTYDSLSQQAHNVIISEEIHRLRAEMELMRLTFGVNSVMGDTDNDTIQTRIV